MTVVVVVEVVVVQEIPIYAGAGSRNSLPQHWFHLGPDVKCFG
jgi:hypothetical protein